ncbi:MAG: MATE family efflux transporter [Clostridia bacterium]|nr:MATE family efflux transporter [Clostridia bacterium]MBR6891023.1 MATE family efflux transporter [Clostridia bacterium]
MLAKIREFFGVQDMTTGSPMSKLIQFSLPLLIGNLAQQLYNTVDSIVVGKYIGDTALAAVGTAGPILNLLLVLFMGVATGASIMASQYFGAKDRYGLSRVVGSTLFLTLVSGLIMMAMGLLASPALIRLIAPPEDVAEGAVIYLRIIFIGIVGGSAYNILSGVLRGMGDSFYPLLFLILACVLNIVLDILFVARFDMGVAGVAWATIIAQAISGVLCLVRLVGMKDLIDVNRSTLVPDGPITRKLCLLGLPAGVTQALFSMSAIVVQSLTNSLGTAVIAANVAIMRVDGFAMMPNFTFGTASTTFVGQNIGAQRIDRVRQGIRDLMKLALITAGVLVACILLFGHHLIGLFTNTEDVIQIGIRGLRWLALGYIAFAVSQVLQGAMRGAGETMIPMWISIVTTILVRLPLAYLLAALTRCEAWPKGRPDALFASLLISWVLGMIITVVAHRKGAWRRRLPPELQKL